MFVESNIYWKSRKNYKENDIFFFSFWKISYSESNQQIGCLQMGRPKIIFKSVINFAFHNILMHSVCIVTTRQSTKIHYVLMTVVM